MSNFEPAKKRIDVSVGESVRIIRELQGMSQNDLAKISGIPQSTISAIENDRINLGVERAKTLAKVLECHPAVLVFPGWEVESANAAQQNPKVLSASKPAPSDRLSGGRLTQT